MEEHMVVETVLAFALGIALAQFFRVYVLAPTTIAGLGGLIWLEVASGHSLAHTLAAVVLVSISLQSGFLSGIFLGGFVVRAKKPFIASGISSSHRYR
jgi:hypothetical protein